MIRSMVSRWFRPRPRTIRNSWSPQRTRLGQNLNLEDRTVPAVHVLDLTGAIGDSGDLNSATFTAVDPQPTGTGYIDPFVRIQRTPSNPSGMEEGYNTDGIEEFDTKDAGGHNWDHSLLLSSLQAVNGYYQFTLDVNETKPGALISLDELQVFVQSAPDLTGASFDGDGTITSWKQPVGKNGFKTVGANLVYDMDAGVDGDSSVLLNYYLNHGSGSGDMTVMIPTSLFPDLKGKQYVYLYSKFGQDVPGAGAEAGFEEWTALVGKNVPQPGPFSISGHKYEDLNGDGNIVGDPTLKDWQINLYHESNNMPGFQTGIGGDEYVKSTTTDLNGMYVFNDLTGDDTYYVTETVMPGWVQTYGGNNGNTYYTTLVNGVIIDLDFGNFKKVDITGTKFTDITGDGITDDDTGLGGVTINLYQDMNSDGVLTGADGDPIASATTAGDGSYSFSGLVPGTYFVKEVVPDGYVQTGGPDYYTVIVGGSGVQSGGTSPNNDFANFELFDICGVKYRDIDKDGYKDANEPLLSGWTIFLDGSNGGTVNGILDPGETSTVTGADGSYCFTDLGPGTYIVREVLKPNWQQFSANPAPITGISGVDVDNVDFGNAMINPGFGHTKGYWHNQNGHDTIAAIYGTASDPTGWTALKADLANLFLRNLDGTLFITASTTQADFDGLLTNESNASNAVSQLSAQLAAAFLNMKAGEAGLTDPDGLPFATGDTLLSVSTAISPTGYITVSDLVAEGRRILHGNNLIGPPLADYDLIDPSPARDYALLVMSALDAFNNSTNIVNA